MAQMMAAALVLLTAPACPAASGLNAGEAGKPTRPEETADAVLHSEDPYWVRRVHAALGLPRWIDFGVDLRTRFETLEGPFRAGEPEVQTQLPRRTRLRLGIDRSEYVRLLVELQDARTSGVEAGGFTSEQVGELDVLQLFVSATGRNIFGKGLRGDLHAGRLTLDVGSRRLVSRNRTRNTSNSFDGLHLQLASPGREWRLRAFHVLPVERDVGAFDDESSFRRRLSGLVFETKRISAFEFEAYLLDFDDDLQRRRIQTIGARILRQPKRSHFDFELEWMQQIGDSRGKDHRAYAAHGEAGFTFEAAWSPRLALQFDVAQGDGDPADDQINAFDPLFGSRRFELAPTGIFGPFQRSNIVSPGLRLILEPAHGLKLQFKTRSWQLEQARGSFSGAGLQDPTGSSGRDLGVDLEVRLNWDPTPWLGFDVGYGHWFKGSYLERAAGAALAADADYFYLAPRVRF